MAVKDTLFKQLVTRKDWPLILVILIAGISLVGWLAGKTIIASISKTFIPVAPSTSVLFLILSILFLVNKNSPKNRFKQLIILCFVTLSAFFSFLILIEFLLKLNIDIENIFIPNPGHLGRVIIGRMSPITALLFGLICIVIGTKLFPDSKFTNFCGAIFSLLIVFVAFVLLLGYLYKAPLLYGGDIIPVALLTAFCFLLFGISLLQDFNVNYWTFNLIKNKAQFQLLKTFLPMVIVVVVMQGLIEINLIVNQKNPTLTTAVIILLIVGLTGFLIMRASKSLSNKLIEAENALKEKTQFLDKVIESSALSTWISDIKGTAIRANPACLNFFGAKENEVVGRYNIFKDSVIEANGFMPLIKDVFEKGIYANIILDYDFALVHHVKVKNATHKIINSIFTPLLDSNGKVTNVIIQTIDLTDIKKIEEAAIKERNKTQQYLDIAGVVLLSLDNNGIVQLINPKGCEIVGYSKEEILGENWYGKFLPTREINRFKTAKLKALTGEIEEMSYIENYIKTKSGEERLIAWRNALLRDENDTIIGTLSSGEDITERKIAEKELIEAKERAEESDHLKTAFLQNISHEIRTPLNSIMGFASLLPDENDKLLIDNYSNIIYKNSEQLVHIIDDIVLYSKLQNKQMSLNLNHFDIFMLLEQVRLSFNLPIYQQDVKLIVKNSSEGPISIYSDYEKIWQIYTNLISNAIKYTSKGDIIFGINRSENEWICYVSDSGIGIPANEIKKIFDRFYRASNVDKGHIGGTGLGLSIVLELVELLGGRIWVESEVGKGSNFFFTIPIIDKN